MNQKRQIVSRKTSPVWHPFTQHGIEHDLPQISRAEGAYLIDDHGCRIYDAISSWWVITHGHCDPRIVSAIQKQADVLDQVIFAGLTHSPAERVAEALIEISPTGLDYVFFSDSGSTAVEVALKMALGYWRNRGEQRTHIIALEHAYHGDTVGTMSAGARGVFNDAYAPLLFDVARVPAPLPESEETCFSALEAACRAPDAAAFVCEPLVLGAGGMLMYSADCLAKMAAICKSHGVLFIADEVMTGFGRTGTMFAVQQGNVQPDIMCLAKGLTGGSVPLAATLCSEEIFDAHYSDDRSQMFFHSSSFTANPIACAAAAANLAIWRDDDVSRLVDRLSQQQEEAIATLADNPGITNLRRCGTISAFDLVTEKQGYLADIALDVRKRALERGVLLRPLGNTVYVMPPYCSSAKDLALVYETIDGIVREVTG